MTDSYIGKTVRLKGQTLGPTMTVVGYSTSVLGGLRCMWFDTGGYSNEIEVQWDSLDEVFRPTK